MQKLTKEDLIIDLKHLGVRTGDLLNVKASLRSIGEIEGGVDTLIDALLETVGSTGTIVTDSFVTVHSPLRRIFWKRVVDRNTPSYAGSLANAILKRNNVYRSNHPVQKFALIGAHAEKLASDHTANSYAYDVLRIMAEIGGKNLKIGDDEKVPGVGTSHVAIGITKIRQKRELVGVRYIDHTGKIRSFYRNWSGGCMQAFYNLNQLYDRTPGAVLARGSIGNASAKLTSMDVTLKAELDLINSNTKAFLTCGKPGCVNCSFSWEIYQCSIIPFVLKALSNGEFKKVVKVFFIKLFYRYPF